MPKNARASTSTILTTWRGPGGRGAGPASPYWFDLAPAGKPPAQAVERAPDVDVRDVHVPVLVRPDRLLKSCAIPGRPPGPTEQPGSLEDAVNAGRADRDDVAVEHHVGQLPVALEREAAPEVVD